MTVRQAAEKFTAHLQSVGGSMPFLAAKEWIQRETEARSPIQSGLVIRAAYELGMATTGKDAVVRVNR